MEKLPSNVSKIDNTPNVNRSPVNGEIKYQRYTCGQFVQAYKKSASFENERHAIGVQNDKMRVLVIQVAGLLARRIVSWVTLGHNLKQGECYGMIKFGSSTELVLPKNVKLNALMLLGMIHLKAIFPEQLYL